jgi:hypothetical protein
MARNDQAQAALAKCEANLLQELENLATADAALAIKEADWISNPIVDHSISGPEGVESWTYSNYINYWNSRRTSVMQTIEKLELLAESLNRRIQAQQPPWQTVYMKVKI